MQTDILKMPEDKARCIAAGLLLEYAYKKFRIEKTKELASANSFGYTQILETYSEKLPEMIAGVRGKPEFVWPEDEENRVFFNLSHSGNYVICAVADFEVGVDIQVRTRVRDSLLRRFFSVEERARIEMCGTDETLRERTFARIWAQKEAETKLTGCGIGQMFGQMMRGDNECASGDAVQYRIWQGEIDEDYAWAVVSYLKTESMEPEVLEMVLVEGGELFYERVF